MRDAWTWVAHYADGSCFEEHGPDGARGFRLALERPDMMAVELRWSENPELPPIRVQLPPDVRPIMFRRRVQSFSGETGEHLGTTTIHVLGWQKTIKVGGFERNVKSYVWIHPDGSVVLTDRDLDD